MDSVVLETNLGDVQLELYWDHAPRVCFLLLTQHSAQIYGEILLDMQKLRRTCETRVLQRSRVPSYHLCMFISRHSVHKPFCTPDGSNRIL